MKKILSLIILLAFLMTSCVGETRREPFPPKDDSPFIGVWLNYAEISDIVCRAHNEKEFKKEVRETILKLKEYSVNNIFLHIRAFDDCFYASSFFPVSKYCADEKGELKFDVLKVFTDICHSESIKVHGWINPFRITYNPDPDELQSGFLPCDWYSASPENQRLIIGEYGIWYNPASLEAQKHIIDGVKEVIEKYDVDGIHFDDYFYPETSPKIDSSFYGSYTDGGGRLSLGEYRRECINSLIAGVYSVIKNYDESIIFSISPAGNIEDDINTHFADVSLWASRAGYADYLIPQLYYGFKNEKLAFENTLENWILLQNGGARLLVGLPLYKTGLQDEYAGSGKNEWLENTDIIARQLSSLQQCEEICGAVFYSGSLFTSEYLSEIQRTELKNIKNTINMPWKYFRNIDG